MDSLIGGTLGSYQILERIGRGGMATVYKAYQPSLERYVAIKILPAHLSDDAGFSRRFQREARAVAKLEHPHILPVHDSGQEGDLSYIVMRYIEGGTLKERMGEPLDLRQVADLIDQIAEAMDYAHEKGIVHRDVKPSNVLLDKGDWVLLTDFGVARMVEGTGKITATGVGVGTPAYMSPEQGRGERTDRRNDVYSLGVMLYEMLTGRVPYEADTPMAVVWKHIHDPLPLPRALRPEIPEGVARVVLKALAKSSQDRYQTAGELAQALQTVMREVEVEDMGTPEIDEEATRDVIVERQERSTLRERLPWLGWVAAFVLLLVVVRMLVAIVPLSIQASEDRLEIFFANTATLEEVIVKQSPTEALTATPTVGEEVSPVSDFGAVDMVLWWGLEDGSMERDIYTKFREWANERAPGSTLKISDYKREDIVERFRAAADEGNSPDLILTSDDILLALARAGLIQPLDELIDLNIYVDPALDSVEFDGKHWGVPIEIGNHLMLLYNKSLVEEPPDTTDELIEMAKNMKERGIWGLTFNVYEPFWMIPWLGGYGGQVFLDDGVTPNLNTSSAISTYRLLQDFRFKDKIMPPDCDYECADKLFKTGGAAMIINGDWSLSDYYGYFGSRLGVARIPDISGAGTPSAYISAIKVFMLSVNLRGERRDAVIDFVDWLAQDLQIQLDSSLPSYRLPTLKKALVSTRVTNDPILAGSAEQMLVGTPMPKILEMRCVWDGMKENMQGVMNGSLTPEEAAAGAQRYAERCVRSLPR